MYAWRSYRPDGLDVRQALRARLGFTHSTPSTWQLAYRRPERILALFIHDDHMPRLVVRVVIPDHAQPSVDAPPEIGIAATRPGMRKKLALSGRA